MSDKTGGVPRYRPYEGPALFAQGFRPFFLGAGLWALIDIAVWYAALEGALSIPSAFGAAAWHAHEMIFGFAVAAVAGFLLTAIPNWTGRMPLQGWALAGLFALWLLGRAAMASSLWIGPGIAAVLDLAFPLLLIAVVLREILAGRNWRNLPMPLALSLFLAANGLTHLEALGWAASGPLGQRLGIAVLAALIGLIGGRVIPSFTRNWLAKRGAQVLPAAPDRFDRLCLALLLAALIAWTAVPEAGATAALLLAAGLASLLRLARWRGQDTLAEPLVWSLHLGFAWLPLGLLLLGLAALLPQDLPASAGLHALSAGAVGSMTLAVMTRASLGHSGRNLSADAWTTAIYLLIAGAAATRVAAALAPAWFYPLLAAAAILWAAAFGVFTLRYGQILLSR